MRGAQVVIRLVCIHGWKIYLGCLYFWGFPAVNYNGDQQHSRHEQGAGILSGRIEGTANILFLFSECYVWTLMLMDGSQSVDSITGSPMLACYMFLLLEYCLCFMNTSSSTFTYTLHVGDTCSWQWH